jgi:hypothetical protein
LGFLGEEFLRRVKEFYGNGISWENLKTEDLGKQLKNWDLRISGSF